MQCKIEENKRIVLVLIIVIKEDYVVNVLQVI